MKKKRVPEALTEAASHPSESLGKQTMNSWKMPEDSLYQDLQLQDQNVYATLHEAAVNQQELSQESVASKDMKVLEKKINFWRRLTIIVSIVTIVTILILTIGLSIFIIQCNKQETQNLQQLQADICDITETRCRYCPRNWLYYSGSCYFFDVNPLNWTKSRGLCGEMRSQLVVIKSQDEQTFVGQRTHGNSWIGLSKHERDGSFMWEDGTILANETSFWQTGLPDMKFADEDCVETNNRGWNDNGCRRERFSICEQPASVL